MSVAGGSVPLMSRCVRLVSAQRAVTRSSFRGAGDRGIDSPAGSPRLTQSRARSSPPHAPPGQCLWAPGGAPGYAHTDSSHVMCMASRMSNIKTRHPALAADCCPFRVITLKLELIKASVIRRSLAGASVYQAIIMENPYSNYPSLNYL